MVGTFGQAAATIRAIADAGLQIPGHISVVGFDGGATDYGLLRLTAVQQPVDALARRALAQLLGEGDVDEEFVASLRIGDTCGCTPR